MRKPLILLVILLFSTIATAKKHAEAIPKPTSFVIGDLTYWDFGPPFNYYALYIVRPSDSRTVIDKVVLTPPTDLCSQHPKLELASGSTPESIDTLLGYENPCAIPDKTLRREARKCKHCQTFSGAVVSMRATCGGQDRLIRANVFEDYWFDPSRRVPGHTSTMMDLVKILDHAVKQEDPTETKAKQSEILEAISKGAYDSLFETKTEKPSILYQGAVTPPHDPEVDLLNSSPILPTLFVPPQYPPIARTAHVQGQATFTLAIDLSGKVTKVTFDNTHPLLKGTIEDAVSKWRYPAGVADQTLHVTLEFKLNCADSRVDR